jgi:hypothetical protein
MHGEEFHCSQFRVAVHRSARALHPNRRHRCSGSRRGRAPGSSSSPAHWAVHTDAGHPHPLGGEGRVVQLSPAAAPRPEVPCVRRHRLLAWFGVPPPLMTHRPRATKTSSPAARSRPSTSARGQLRHCITGALCQGSAAAVTPLSAHRLSLVWLGWRGARRPPPPTSGASSSNARP